MNLDLLPDHNPEFSRGNTARSQSLTCKNPTRVYEADPGGSVHHLQRNTNQQLHGHVQTQVLDANTHKMKSIHRNG